MEINEKELKRLIRKAYKKGIKEGISIAKENKLIDDDDLETPTYINHRGFLIRTKKDIPPTYCKGCSFKCQASDCECKCHDKIREYWSKKR